MKVVGYSTPLILHAAFDAYTGHLALYPITPKTKLGIADSLQRDKIVSLCWKSVGNRRTNLQS